MLGPPRPNDGTFLLILPAPVPHPRFIAGSYGLQTNKVLAARIRESDATVTKYHHMNPELLNQALAKVLNSHVLVNLVSRRVRQLNAGGRPLISDTGNLGAADVALLEIIEDKMGFDMPEIIELIRPSAQAGNRPSGWIKPLAAKTKLAA